MNSNLARHLTADGAASCLMPVDTTNIDLAELRNDSINLAIRRHNSATPATVPPNTNTDGAHQPIATVSTLPLLRST